MAHQTIAGHKYALTFGMKAIKEIKEMKEIDVTDIERKSIVVSAYLRLSPPISASDDTRRTAAEFNAYVARARVPTKPNANHRGMNPAAKRNGDRFLPLSTI